MALGNNPKDIVGSKKVSISKLPMVGLLHGAHAMMYGSSKYGPYNWRGNAVIASIYVDATMRHLAAWFDSKEEIAPDSGVHHLGHVLANMAILLDAIETGNLVDDRPKDGKASEVLTRLNDVVGKSNVVPHANGSTHPPKNASVGHSEPQAVLGVLSCKD